MADPYTIQKRSGPAWTEGIITGLIGAAVVALFYLCIDVARGHPLLTPSTLGQALVMHQPVTPDADYRAVVAYSVLHFVAFMLFGVILAKLTRAAETSNFARYAEFQLLVIFTVFFYGVVSVGNEVVRGMMPFIGVVIANILAGGIMVAWLWSRHPRLRTVSANTELGGTDRRSDVTTGVR